MVKRPNTELHHAWIIPDLKELSLLCLKAPVYFSLCVKLTIIYYLMTLTKSSVGLGLQLRNLHCGVLFQQKYKFWEEGLLREWETEKFAGQIQVLYEEG